jgi:hypothetical protein
MRNQTKDRMLTRNFLVLLATGSKNKISFKFSVNMITALKRLRDAGGPKGIRKTLRVSAADDMTGGHRLDLAHEEGLISLSVVFASVATGAAC